MVVGWWWLGGGGGGGGGGGSLNAEAVWTRVRDWNSKHPASA